MDCCDILFSIGVIILVMITLIWSLKELMIGSLILYRFFLTPLLQTPMDALWTGSEHNDYIYILTFLSVFFSILGSALLYQALICSGYFDGFKLFQLAFLLSLSFSISIWFLNYTAGYDTYEYHIERDMYVKVSAQGDYLCDRYNCYKTPVYFMHQNHRCCGWHRPDELAKYSFPAPPTSGQLTSGQLTSGQPMRDKLPLFCCEQHPNVLPNCSLNSTFLFNQTCRQFADEFWRVSHFDPNVVNPTTFWSITMKIILVFGYAIARREMLLPTSDARFPDNTLVGRN